MKKHIAVIVIWLSASLWTVAQMATVQGIVTGNEKTPIP